jgi:hypothetical protein
MNNLMFDYVYGYVPDKSEIYITGKGHERERIQG